MNLNQKLALTPRRNPEHTLSFSVFTIVFEGQPFVEVNIRESLRQADFVSVVEGATNRESPHLGIGQRITGKPDSADGTREVLKKLASEFPKQLRVTFANGHFWRDKTAMVAAAVEKCPHGILLQKDIDEFWTDHQITTIRTLFENFGFSDMEFYCRHFWGTTRHHVDLSHKEWGSGAIWRRAFHYDGNIVDSHEPPRFRRRWEMLLENDETRSLGLVFWHYSYADPRILHKKEKFYGLRVGQLSEPMEDWKRAGCPLVGAPCGHLVEYEGKHPIDISFLES